MSLFKCERCATLENTALGAFWGEKHKLCSECARGRWHRRFEKRLWDPSRDYGWADGDWVDDPKAR